MNKEQLSAAIGGIEEAMLSDALTYAPKTLRRPIRRGLLIAACLAAIMAVGAAAITLAGGWRVVQGAPESAGDVYEIQVMRGEDGEFQFFPTLVNGGYRVTGKAALAAYPLSDAVCERIRSNVAADNQWHDYRSLDQVEDTYGIRLLRSGGEVRDIEVLEGVYGDDLPVAGGLFLSPGWVEQHAGWGGVTVSATLATAARDAEDLSGGGATISTHDELTIQNYEVQSLGVTAQIAFSNGDQPEAHAFLVKDDISYLIGMHPRHDAFATACALLETLHY